MYTLFTPPPPSLNLCRANGRIPFKFIINIGGWGEWADDGGGGGGGRGYHKMKNLQISGLQRLTTVLDVAINIDSANTSLTF